MKKMLLVVAVLLMAAPAMATVNITATQVPGTLMVDIGYDSTTEAVLVRAFALDLTVNNSATIVDVNQYKANGESTAASKGYGIYPGTIDINSVVGPNLGHVDSYGTPVAPVTDPGALGGIGTAGVTLEMGSLYNAAVPADAPTKGPATLCRIKVSKGCTLNIVANATRGGVVMEDATSSLNTNLPQSLVILPPCINIPAILNDTLADANLALSTAGFTNPPVIAYECNNTYPANHVCRQDTGCVPSTTIIHYWVSTGPCCPPAPGQASNPTPAVNAINVSQTQDLSWTPGANTATQDIYFGTANPPPSVASGVPVGTTTYDTGTMPVYTKYYWRIDELNICGVKTTGTVWCFLIGPQAGKPSCLSEAVPCLGDIQPKDARVRTNDIGRLVTFISGLGSPYNCATSLGSTTCPTCYDINGDGRIRTNDIAAMVSYISGLGSPYNKACPWPSCP